MAEPLEPSSNETGASGSRLEYGRNRKDSKDVLGSTSSLTSTGSCGSLQATNDATESAYRYDSDSVVISPEYLTPIIGYEIMEERARFTLKMRFPGVSISLPPKRWFRDNYDPAFLEDRQLGLQAFIRNVMCHRDISKTTEIRDFFCLDDPPEPLDTIEESRALCESMEEQVYRLTQQLREKDLEIEVLRNEVDYLRSQQSVLVRALQPSAQQGDAVTVAIKEAMQQEEERSKKLEMSTTEGVAGLAISDSGDHNSADAAEEIHS